MNNKFLKDYLASRIICEDKKVNGYDKVFYKTNEDLLDIYLDIDFYDKDVLSVQASGDQVLTARFLDAKNVDSFDINRLTLYYFYLRLWSIKYRDRLYPEVEDGNKWMKRLIREVEPGSEMEKKALDFYKMHLKKNTNIENMFFAIEAQEKGKTLFTKAEELKDNLSPKLRFKEMDLFKKNKVNRKYDIALISNILEWAKNDDKKLETACDNLDRMLNKDGVVVCSNLIYRTMFDKDRERDIFSKSFDCERKGRSYIYRKK